MNLVFKRRRGGGGGGGGGEVNYACWQLHYINKWRPASA